MDFASLWFRLTRKVAFPVVLDAPLTTAERIRMADNTIEAATRFKAGTAPWGVSALTVYRDLERLGLLRFSGQTGDSPNNGNLSTTPAGIVYGCALMTYLPSSIIAAALETAQRAEGAEEELLTLRRKMQTPARADD